jgi:hypothetical protein
MSEVHFQATNLTLKERVWFISKERCTFRGEEAHFQSNPNHRQRYEHTKQTYDIRDHEHLKKGPTQPAKPRNLQPVAELKKKME